MLARMSTEVIRERLLDTMARHRVFAKLSPHRLIALLESADVQTYESGELVFEQFHPATTFYLLFEGAATEERQGADRTKPVSGVATDWPEAAVGWSGFLPPYRYGSTMRAAETLTALCWSHEALASHFYADPELGICFYDLVLDSVGKAFERFRLRRMQSSRVFFEPPAAGEAGARRPVVGRADSCLQRSAFFAAFDDEAIEALSGIAVLESFAAGDNVVREGDDTGGLLLLATGRCSLAFEDKGSEGLRPFRRVRDRSAIVAGVPNADGEFLAEAGVWAETDCWFYRIPAKPLRQLQMSDPEFGRAFQHRLLMRIAGLIGAVELIQDEASAEPEIAAIVATLANNQARLPVTSNLFKLPYLLRNQLTVGNAFATLKHVQETGAYHERLLAAQCREMADNLAAEHAFYQAIVQATDEVSSIDDSVTPEDARMLCDRLVTEAFEHLDCRVDNLERLPERGGYILIINHMQCPEHYMLPNGYHFSFDTAFACSLIWQRRGKSAVRVVRESPGAEFGHNIFYRKLAPIIVPTVESGLQSMSEEAFIEARREAGRRFGQEGKKILAAGTPLLICPEGQSQPEAESPGHFHSGAFRLALDAGCPIVPVALAGFGRRYKDGPLVASVGELVHVPKALAGDSAALRDWIGRFRDDFANEVRKARSAAYGPPQFHALVEAS